MAEPMITSVRATPVRIPFEAPYRWHAGVHAGFNTTIVEIETSDGVIGIGETPTETGARVLDEILAPRLIGKSALDLAECDRICLPAAQTGANLFDLSIVRAYAGVEMALWDIRGKYFNTSIADLLGGRVRSVVPFSEYFALRLPSGGHGGESTPVEVARYCERMAEAYGSTVFEGKVATADLQFEIEMVREIRAALGDGVRLRLDANMGWSTSTARYALRAFERFDVESIEEPVSTLEELARLRPNTEIAFSSHDANLRAALRLGVPDAFVINLAVRGGIRGTLAFIAACEEAGVEVRFYSPDSGVATAAYLQIAAAIPWMSHANQTLLHWHRDDVIHQGPFCPREGVLNVPDGPGLGVELDSTAVARCHNRFLGESSPVHASGSATVEERPAGGSRRKREQQVELTPTEEGAR